MTNRYEELIKAFDFRLQKLISQYKSLQEKNKELNTELARKQNDLMLAHQEILELRKKNDHLKIANGFGGSELERAETKQQINKMVREIDKCIALLDE